MPTGESIGSNILIGMAAMILLFGSFLVAVLINQRKKLQHQKDLGRLHARQQNQLIEAAVKSEELERHRIAEALHDEVGAILSSSKLHFQGVKHVNMDQQDQQLFQRGEELLDEVIQKVRGISHNLHSNILKEFGLNEALRHFTSKISTSPLILIETDLDNSYDSQGRDKDISIYRLLQELINNIIKHTRASRIELSSQYNAGNLVIQLVHDGVGLTQEQFESLRYGREGMGLKNIQNRIILLKSKITFGRNNEDYFTIINIPIE